MIARRQKAAMLVREQPAVRRIKNMETATT
jgi:hypothetical protein